MKEIDMKKMSREMRETRNRVRREMTEQRKREKREKRVTIVTDADRSDGGYQYRFEPRVYTRDVLVDTLTGDVWARDVTIPTSDYSLHHDLLDDECERARRLVAQGRSIEGPAARGEG